MSVIIIGGGMNNCGPSANKIVGHSRQMRNTGLARTAKTAMIGKSGY